MREVIVGLILTAITIAILALGSNIHQANRLLSECQHSSKTDCHIEWDGLGQGFNVYWQEQ